MGGGSPPAVGRAQFPHSYKQISTPPPPIPLITVATAMCGSSQPVQKRKRRSPAAAARSRRRLQQWKEKKDKARLVSELRTTPWRPVKQIRSANLLERLDKYHFDVEWLTNVETLEEKKAKSTVLFSNHSQTSMLPQLTSPSLTPKTLHQTSPSEMISQVHIDRRCPSCCAWIMPVTTE